MTFGGGPRTGAILFLWAIALVALISNFVARRVRVVAMSFVWRLMPLALLLAATLYSAEATAASSQYCPTLNATVMQGGSVQIDVTTCDGTGVDDIGVGWDGMQPPHGTLLVPSPSGAQGTQIITYTHNGDSATSDTFPLEDGAGDTITVNITITPGRTASIAVSPPSANEDSGTAFVYTVTLSQTNTSATTVNLTRSGTANSGTDYSGAVTSVVVPANTSSASFGITAIADTTVEADETVIFQVASGSGYSIGNPSSATATILNDDVPSASVAVSPASVSEDGSANLVYTVTLDQPSLSALSIGFSVGGTATSGTDYATVNSPLVIATGQTSGTITVDPTPDSTVEPDETVVISLNAGSGYTVGSPSSATGTILNDDQPSLSINDVSVNEGNAGTTNATFTVSLSQPAGTGGVSFDIATSDGTATAGVDYVASSVTGQTIPAGSSSATFTVLVNGDTLNEPNETFFVNVSNVVGAIIADGQGQGTIVNDDAQPALSIDDVSVNEGNSGTTTATFTVSLSAASGQTVTVNYATADGTATAGSDYVARSGTLTFAPGVTAQGVAVTVNGDTAVEPNETFSMALSGASNASIARTTGTATILNDDAVVTISPVSLPATTAGTAFSQTLIANGGTAPYGFAITAGALPAGMTLNTAGVLSGTPTASGSFNFTVTATDSSGSPASGSRAYTLTVASPTITLPATTLAGGAAGQAYTAVINQATGGIAPYTYALGSGALPAGVTVNPTTGALSGTPTVAGTFVFTLTATDSTAGTAGQASQSYSLSIVSPTLSITPATLPGGSFGVAYSQTLSSTGGTAPYGYAITAGALPGGITLDTAGLLSGTPNAAGSFSFNVSVTDANGFSATQAYTVTVASPTIAIAPSTLPTAMVGTAFSQPLNANGGTAPYSFAIGAGTLPSGLSLNAAGVLSGTPTAAGSFPVTVTATDANGFTGSQSYTLAVAPSVTFSFSPPGGTLAEAMAGEDYSAQITATGGAGPLLYSISSGGLPDGLTLNASTGELTGPVSAAATVKEYVFTVQVRDNNGATGTATYTLAVKGRSVSVTDQQVTVPAGSTPNNVDLTRGATGGPFVSAQIASVEPANAGTFAIVRGEFAQANPPATLGWYLKFTPDPAYSGQVSVRFRLISALGVSNTGTVTYSIGYDAAKVANDIDDLVHGFVRSRQNMISSTIHVPGLLERRQMEQATDPVTARMMPSESGMTVNFSTSFAQLEAARDRADGVGGGYSSPFNVWIDGAFLAHNDKDINGDRWGSFAMINLGADYLLNEKALVGLSFHYDRMTSPTDADAELKGNGWLAGPYASLEVGKGVFWNASLRYGGSSNDIDTTFWDGSFETTRWMADTSIEGQWDIGQDTILSPKLRAVYFSEKVDDYAVRNSAGDIIGIEGFDEEQFRVSLGAEISRSFTLDSGSTLVPKVGLTGGFSGLDGSGAFGQLTAGVAMQTTELWMLDASLLFNIEGEGEKSVGGRVRAAKKF